jgi:mono/diheme cytochrome c family protein
MGADSSPGRALFRSQGCFACHGANAQGTNLAPSLIGVGAKFPGDSLPNLLHHPTSKMRAGGMPVITVNDAQMVQLVAYLQSLKPAVQDQFYTDSNVAAAQRPPAVAGAALTAQAHEARVPPNPLALRGQAVFQRNACQTCHGAEGLNGTVAAPGLAGTASLLPASILEDLLRHYSARMQKGGMPLTNFNAQDMKAIVAYIRSLSESPEEQKLLASGKGIEKN